MLAGAVGVKREAVCVRGRGVCLVGIVEKRDERAMARNIVPWRQEKMKRKSQRCDRE